MIDWLLHLPADLEERLRDEIHQIEQEARMRYVTSFERIGIRKGMEKGLEKGLESERRAPRLARLTQPTRLDAALGDDAE